MRRVPFARVDLENPPDVIDDAIAEIEELARKGRFIGGDSVAQFERGAAQCLDTNADSVVACSNGSDALVMALMALGVDSRHAVIIPDFTFFATAGAALRVGAGLVILDVDPKTGMLDVDQLQTFLRRRCLYSHKLKALVDYDSGRIIKVIIPVHLFGQCHPRIGDIMEIAGINDLVVVEDAAQAFGCATVVNGEIKYAGTIGHVGCFSFFPAKGLGAWGDAGMVIANRQEHFDSNTFRAIRQHGAVIKYHNKMLGGNFRMDAIQAAVLSVKLKSWAETRRTRLENGTRYIQKIADLSTTESGLMLPRLEGKNIDNIFTPFVIRYPLRNTLRRYLGDWGVETEIHYPSPISSMPVLDKEKYVTCPAGINVHARDWTQSVLSLPFWTTMNKPDQEYVMGKVREFINKQNEHPAHTMQTHTSLPLLGAKEEVE